MKLAMIDIHNDWYKPMADLTLEGKQSYAKKYGYEFFSKVLDSTQWDTTFGNQKLYWLSELMEQRPDIEWFWHSGTDTLITNHNISLESLIDDNVHFIVCKDGHCICADVFFIRNTPEGREYIKHLQDPHPGGSEQGHMIDDEHKPKWRAITKYLPNAAMNAYAGEFYPHKNGIDGLRQREFWQPGDLLVHAVTGLLTHLTADQIFQWKLNVIKSRLPYVII
jgi:hypothetical protein